MEAGPRTPPPTNNKKKKPPLTDRTNFSVVLHNIKSSISSPNPNPNTSSSYPPKRLDLNFSGSETSFGSSSFSEIGPNTSSRSAPNRGNKSCNLVEPVYRRKKATEKTKDGGKTSLPLTIYSETSMSLTIYSDEKTKAKGKSATGKLKDSRKIRAIPRSCTSMVNTRNKTKENVEPSSCPPLPRTRKRSGVFNEVVNICVSHSYSAPHLDDNKKSRLLTGEDDSENEYVEQQKAYFKEIDGFELAEEEVSENESESEDTSRETLTK